MGAAECVCELSRKKNGCLTPFSVPFSNLQAEEAPNAAATNDPEITETTVNNLKIPTNQH